MHTYIYIYIHIYIYTYIYIHIYICIYNGVTKMMMMLFIPERRLLTLGQQGDSPQRHTAAGTAAPTTTDTGNTVPQREM